MTSRSVAELDEAEWRSNPEGAEPPSSGLAGVGGVIVFLVELFHASHEQNVLEDARQIASRLSERIARIAEPGFYDGLSGAGFALAELAKASGERRFLDGALRCLRLLEERAQRAGSGVEWIRPTRDAASPPNAPTHARTPADVYRGLAGIGLFLLSIDSVLDDGRALELAADAGRRLIERADRTAGGLDWALDSTYAYRMPNFSHGTAGVCYFLATLARASGDRAFLAAAIDGARYLQSIAYTDHDLCLIPDTDSPRNGASQVPYELGWCHGPSGTGRLWWRLYEATGDEVWIEWMRRSARAYLPGAIPDSMKEAVVPMEGNAYCHGLPGNADFLFGLSRALGNQQYADVGLQMIDTCLAQAVDLGDRLTWYQSGRMWNPETEEWETDWEFPQIGFLTGNAGVGLALLHADALTQGRLSAVRLPDFPFPI